MSKHSDQKTRTCVLQALAQIERTAAMGIWNAHWGCAVIAGALLIEENLVEAETKLQIMALLELISTEQRGFAKETNPKRHFLERRQFAEQLFHELSAHADEARELGHATIYSAYVLKALNHFELMPWESLLVSFRDLIRNIDSSSFGWITINGINQPARLEEPVKKTGCDYWTIFAQFDRPLSMEIGDMQLGHLLTHGHAIQMLDMYADSGFISTLDQGYRRRLHGLRLANEIHQDKTPLRFRKIDPRLKDYWVAAGKFGDMHGHIFKYAYSFLASRRETISSVELELFGRIVWPDKNLT